jgi:hypothetical protein
VSLPLEGRLIVAVAALDNIGTGASLAASVSVSSVVTLGAAVGLLLMWLPARLEDVLRPQPGVVRALARDKSKGMPKALWLWFAWVLVSFSWNQSIGKWAIQNVCVYAGFMFSVDLLARHASLELGKRFIRMMMWVIWLTSIAYLITVLKYGLGTNAALSARGSAIQDALLTGTAVLAWRSLRIPVARFLPIVLLVAVSASLSRMALAICILGVASAWAVSGKRRKVISRRAFLRLLGGVAAAAAAFAYLVFNWKPLHDRFLGGDNASVAGLSINTSGRLAIWRLLWDNAWSSMTHVFIGQGAGTSELLVQAHTTRITDPHNDFLRMFFDFGAVGFVLFTVGMIALAIRAYRWATDEPDRQIAAVHWASFLATCALLGSMITDNPVTYSFTMLPYGALVGLSMGLARKRATQLASAELQMQAPESIEDEQLADPRLRLSSG